MGKAARWFKGLLGMKKEKNKEVSSNSSSVSNANKKEKKNWNKDLESSSNVLSEIPVNIPGILSNSDASWLRSYISETGKEQNKHAIAVAAATAAAADAAVAAAQAAVAVVRLTSQGRGALFGGGRDRWAAVKIQTVFRGFLARKALRALKGLVKIQALVRGYLVRKRATATLHSMQALIRAQAAVRSQRARRSLDKENIYHHENRPRRSIERFDETRSELHSKRLSGSYENPMNSYDDSPKIVEIDTFKPRSRSRRITTAPLSNVGEDYPYYAVSSPLPCPIASQLSIPSCRHSQDMEWCSILDECRFSTAQNTPRFTTSSFRSNATTMAAPATPARSVCGDSFFRPYQSSSNFPNYMANTQSFSAKLRSHSAPKQRPECGGCGGTKKRLSLNEIMAARNSISGVRMHRSYIQDVLNEPEL